VLAVELLACTHGEPEAMAQAFEVRKTLTVAPPAASRAAKRHTVAAGESLSKISQGYYGTLFKWPVIFEANRRIIGRDPDRLMIGVELTIPDLPRVGNLPRFH
jgi:nucleoid-associated protein YgaU